MHDTSMILYPHHGIMRYLTFKSSTWWGTKHYVKLFSLFTLKRPKIHFGRYVGRVPVHHWQFDLKHVFSDRFESWSVCLSVQPSRNQERCRFQVTCIQNEERIQTNTILHLTTISSGETTPAPPPIPLKKVRDRYPRLDFDVKLIISSDRVY